MPQIANCKHAGNIRLEQERIAIECPSLGPLVVSRQIRPGQYEAQIVSFDEASQPVRPWQSSDKDENRARRHALNRAGIRTQYGDFFESRFPVDFRHASMSPYLNVGSAFDLLD